MRKNIVLATFLCIMSSLTGFADSWKVYPSLGVDVEDVVETSDFVYYTALIIPESELLENRYSLFRYDKKNDEMQPLSTDNNLASNTIQKIQYNPKKDYLAVIYANSDIDLLHDNGKITNIPTYRLASMSSSKKVNSVTIDPGKDRLYLSTGFGYVALNDKKGEIAESRDYGRNIKSVARVGDRFVVALDNELKSAPYNDLRITLDDYEPLVSLEEICGLYPLSETLCLVVYAGTDNKALGMIENIGGNLSLRELEEGDFYNIENNAEGVTITTHSSIIQYDSKGNRKLLRRPEEDRYKRAASYNMSEIWHATATEGLKSGKNNNGTWTMTRDNMLPDTPAPFYSSSMEMHPTKGLMVNTYGHDMNFTTLPHSAYVLFSGHDGGRWTQYSPIYNNYNYRKTMKAPLGLAVDPIDNNYVWLTSKYNGLLRVNLNDPTDLLHLSSKSDESANLDNFVDFLPVQRGEYEGTSHLSVPHFDYYGNLWTSYADYENKNALALYYWSAADRKASTNPQNVILPKKVEVKGYASSNMEELLPLKMSGRRNWLVYANKTYNDYMLVIDTNGTPEDNSDDRVAEIINFYDQDGNVINVHAIKTMLEDQATGNVWVGHEGGVFYFNPADVLSGQKNVYRVKVSRNDGTNLADYLLNEVTVNKIISDPAGRKWFATAGGGLVCTSYDGREIIDEVNTSNSGIPSDMTYCIAYDTKANSIMVSTDEGLAEYFPSSSSSGIGDNEDIKAYPNPVRPGYMGYVTIEGVPSGSVVKIADSAGNVIKELGRESGSEAKWDVTNMRFQRVASGVYYIMVSPGENSSSSAIVGKVLVVN